MSNSTPLAPQVVQEILQTLQDPYLGENLISANVVHKIDITTNLLKITFRLGFPIQSYQAPFLSNIRQLLNQKLLNENPDLKIELGVTSKISSHIAQKGLKGIKGVKNVIAIASGKGGVGKSTTSVNLALALQLEGARVGILDADIYGPSQPRMLGLPHEERPAITENKRMIPCIAHGLQTMSMGFLVPEESAMIWRGPMVSSAISQLAFETDWQDLDYLIVDLPPGTGDIQLTMAQKIPVSGAVIITTPQDIALADAKKALIMFNKLDIPVLGLIENMSLHTCSYCGHSDPIFGSEGGLKMANQYEIPFLGKLPLDRSIQEQSDKGYPSVIADQEGVIAGIYREIARRMTAVLSLQPRDYRSDSPSVVLNNS